MMPIKFLVQHWKPTEVVIVNSFSGEIIQFDLEIVLNKLQVESQYFEFRQNEKLAHDLRQDISEQITIYIT